MLLKSWHTQFIVLEQKAKARDWTLRNVVNYIVKCNVTASLYPWSKGRGMSREMTFRGMRGLSSRPKRGSKG